MGKFNQTMTTGNGTMQLGLFSAKAESILRDEEKANGFLAKVRAWLNAHQDNKILGPVIGDILTMVDLLSDYVHGKYRQIPFGAVLLIAAAILYVVSPVDVIPDIYIGVGWLDDVAVVASAVKMGLAGELKKYKAWKLGQKEERIRERILGTLNEIKDSVADTECLAAIFLSEENRLECLLAEKDCAELPMEVKVVCRDLPYAEGTTDELVTRYGALIDEVDFEWSMLGKISFMPEQAYKKFEEHFEIIEGERYEY